MIPIYEPVFLKYPEKLEARLMAQLGWVQRDNTPRMEYWATKKNEPYTYGKGRGERTYEPNPLKPAIELCRMDVERHLDCKFEGCFLNRYDKGNDALGWHADDDPAIDHTRPIVVLSLGAARRIEWRANGEKGTGSINGKVLEPGSLFIMPAGMQHTHMHRIPKAPQLEHRRISLTFRGLL
jgi:alkylated DNA repair dioxygenase AlkB